MDTVEQSNVLETPFTLRDFVEAVSFEDAGRLSSNIEAPIGSHIMGFMCEKSRLSSKQVAVKI